LYDAHADLRAEGKLPASAIMESTELNDDYDPSIITEEELEMIREIQDADEIKIDV
jgi:hypothetical protein